jgi:iron only hydrogenase large subunit-like protein
MISGCCPSWILYAEQNASDFLSNISSIKSPQQISGALIRTWIADKYNIKASDIYSVAIMPCTSKKNEAQRAEMTRKGLPDIDTVLTTRELARLIRLNGIDILNLEHENTDEPMGAMSSTGKLVGVSGGTLESLIRTIHHKFYGEDPPFSKLARLRISKGIKEVSFTLGNHEIEAVAVSGMLNAAKVLDDIRSGRKKYHLLEIMACPGGCINGGGQPIGIDENTLKNRSRSLYDYDSRETIKMPHKNPQVIKAYNEFLSEPNGKMSKELFFVNYSKPQSE